MAVSRNLAREAAIIDAYRSGLTLKVIAQSYGVSPDTVWRALSRHGVPRDRYRRQQDFVVDGDIVRIPLTKGREAIIDLADLPLVEGRSWFAQEARNSSGRFYVTAHGPDGQKLYLHRVILNAEAGQIVDHADGDGLNNLRCNLRLADYSLNGANRGPTRVNTSGFKGVFWNPDVGKWFSQIKVRGRYHRLGWFTEKSDAAEAYAIAAKAHWGEFARTE